jgi:CBS domain containing-hemolysin-like protein
MKPAYGKYFLSWRKEPQHFITAILIGNTVVNMLFAYIFSFLLFTLLKFATPLPREILSLLLTTTIILIFGEMLPKNISYKFPETVSLLTIQYLYFVKKLLTPAIKFTKLVSQKFFQENLTPSKFMTLDELQYLIKFFPHTEGPEETKQYPISVKAYFERILNINETAVESIMVPFDKIDMVDISADKEKIVDYILESGHTRIPAFQVNKNNIIGYIHAHDILTKLYEKEYNGKDWHINEVLREITFTNKHTTVKKLMEEFKTKHLNISIIVDDNNSPVGLVTFEDIVEEIVGEIIDEYELKKLKI